MPYEFDEDFLKDTKDELQLNGKIADSELQDSANNLMALVEFLLEENAEKTTKEENNAEPNK